MGQSALDMIDVIPTGVVRCADPPKTGTHGCRNGGSIVQNEGFDPLFQEIGQFEAVAAENLDTVEFRRIVRGGDHNTRIGAVLTNKIRNGRSGHRTQTDHVRSHGAKTRHHAAHQHIGGKTGIRTDHEDRTVATSFGEHGSGRTTDGHSSFTSQLRIGDAAHAIRTKNSTHKADSAFLTFLLSKRSAFPIYRYAQRE